jgi:hypothetical protein
MRSLRYELELRPADGETLPVAEGLLWLRMPLPFALNHIKLWLLRGLMFSSPITVPVRRGSETSVGMPVFCL